MKSMDRQQPHGKHPHHPLQGHLIDDSPGGQSRKEVSSGEEVPSRDEVSSRERFGVENPGLPAGGGDPQAQSFSLNHRTQVLHRTELMHRTVDSPLGPLLLVASPAGLVRVAYSVEDHEDVLDGLAELTQGGVGQAGAALDEPARQLEDYFAGRRNGFTVPLDLPDPPPTFGARVLQVVRQVPYGAVATYTDIAALAGRPDSVRAAGAACARNPLPIVVPCHRVVKLDGSPGQYVAGPAAKRWLLRFETMGPDL